MDTLPLVLDDIGKVAAKVKEEHLADPCMPPTVLFVYHDGLLSAVFDSRDPYCDEAAKEIIATTTPGSPWPSGKSNFAPCLAKVARRAGDGKVGSGSPRRFNPAIHTRSTTSLAIHDTY